MNEVLGQDLECNLAPQTDVDRSIDDSHAATADLFDNLIMREGAAHHGGSAVGVQGVRGDHRARTSYRLRTMVANPAAEPGHLVFVSPLNAATSGFALGAPRTTDVTRPSRGTSASTTI